MSGRSQCSSLLALLLAGLSSRSAFAQAVTAAPVQAPAPVPGLAGAGIGSMSLSGPSGLQIAPAAIGSLGPSSALPVSPRLTPESAPAVAPAAVALSKTAPSAVSAAVSPLNGSVSQAAPAAAVVSKEAPSAVLPLNSAASHAASPAAAAAPRASTPQDRTAREVPSVLKFAGPEQLKAFVRTLRNLSQSLPDLSKLGPADSKAAAEADFGRRIGEQDGAGPAAADLSPQVVRMGRLRSPAEAGLLPAADGWREGTLPSPVDEAPIRFKSIPGRDAGATPTVFLGGLALTESFESLFAVQGRPAGDQYFPWLRAYPPTPWAPAKDVLTADARDLARMIVIAAARSGQDRVDLALHSYGTAVFQRMVQLRADPEVAQALRLLAGGRVTLVNFTTHYGDSEKANGADLVQTARAVRQLMSYIDHMDWVSETAWKSAGENPFLRAAAAAWDAAWKLQRDSLFSLAIRQVIQTLQDHLSQPWDPSIEHVRRRLLDDLPLHQEDLGWAEAAVRRTHGLYTFELDASDIEAMKALGLRATLLHSHDDQLLTWETAQTLTRPLGIATPDRVPPAGTTLKDPTGSFILRIVDGDHYFPLRNPRELGKILEKGGR